MLQEKESVGNDYIFSDLSVITISFMTLIERVIKLADEGGKVNEGK